MASSSAQKMFKYDVFLSFRGEDTRKTFVDHLYHALQQRGIITYKDDIRMEKGESISDQLIRSIQDSRFHIIVFSKNYASSSWCLEELVKIMECHKTNKQAVYPVFFDVEPTEVRNQIGAVGKAFRKHVNKEGAQRWRNALKEAVDLAGWELKNTSDGHEVQFIQKIVDDISRKSHFSNLSFNDKLVGMKTRVKKVLSSLEFGSSDVQMIGIKGIRGGGKTALARAIFDHISIMFEGKSFVENVKQGSKRGSGLKDLQNQILQDVSNDQNIYVKSVFEGENMMKRILGSRKVLLVLDNVDHVSQLEALAGDPTWFKTGSIIIVTTRDKHVLVAHHVNFIHDINLLSHAESILLFSRHTFKSETPSEGFEELSEKVVHYGVGLPLIIKVLGSFLCQKTKHEWQKIIERLEKNPLKETLGKLEPSYQGMEDDDKEIFFDVVRMLKVEQRHEASEILESCGYHAEIGLTILEEKCLMSISPYGLHLHDHIEEMARNIVRSLHPVELIKHNQLWIRIKKEIEYILLDDLGTKATRSFELMYTDLHPHIITKGLRRKMEKFTFLHVVSRHVGYGNIVEESNEFCQHLPNSLQYLYWTQYPFGCLPNTFQAKKLVNLEMRGSKISQLWEGEETKVFNSLRFLNLSSSRLRTLDLGMTPNLEILSLNGCKEFVKLKMPDECPHLKSLDLVGCSNPEELYVHECPHLKSLDLEGCSALEELYMHECPHLKSLDLGGCTALAELHMHVELPHLEFLNLSYSKLRDLNLGLIPNLSNLFLEGCEEFIQLVIPTPCLKLEILKLTRSKVCELNLEQTPNLVHLYLSENYQLVELEMPDECLKLEAFQLRDSKVSRLFVWAPHLSSLSIHGCHHLKTVAVPEGCLKQVDDCLDLSGWSSLEFVMQTPLELPPPVTTLQLFERSVDRCPMHPANTMPQFQYICSFNGLASSAEKVIFLSKCTCRSNDFDPLSEIASDIDIDMQGLRVLIFESSGSSRKVLPEGLCHLKTLERLKLTMGEITHLPDNICMLNHLKYLELSSCSRLEQLPKDLDKLECLEELIVKGCGELGVIPDSICNMKSLKCLHLLNCNGRIKLPTQLGRLECLEELNIQGTHLPYLPRSIYQLKGLLIIGSRMQLELYGVTSLIQISESSAFGYIDDPSLADVQP